MNRRLRNGLVALTTGAALLGIAGCGEEPEKILDSPKPAQHSPTNQKPEKSESPVETRIRHEWEGYLLQNEKFEISFVEKYPQYKDSVKRERESWRTAMEERVRAEAEGYVVLQCSGGSDHYNTLVYDSQGRKIGDIRYANAARESAARSGNPLHYEALQGTSAASSDLVFYKYPEEERK